MIATRPRTASALGALSALALALALSACGGGSGSPATTPAGSDFTAKANAACLEVAKRQTAIRSTVAAFAFTKRQAITTAARLLAADGAMLKAYEALDPPADQQAAWDSYLEALKRYTREQRQILEGARKGNSAYAAATDAQKSDEDATLPQATKNLRADACAFRMSPSQSKAVAAAIVALETTSYRDQCADSLTHAYVVHYFRTLAACRRFQQGPHRKELAKAVRVKILSGVDGVRAFASARSFGGSSPGRAATYAMVFQDGRWKVSNSF